MGGFYLTDRVKEICWISIPMQLSFRHQKLRKEFEDRRELIRNRGEVRAKKIMTRMAQMEAAQNLAQLRPPQPGRFHPLTADKNGLLACDLDGPYRLIFESAHDPAPTLADGGLDWAQVTEVRIIGVQNYHE